MSQEQILTIRIVTPQESLFSAQADMVVMPGDQGEFGILPKHMPLITMLKEGILKLYNRDNIVLEIMVSKGYGQVFNDEILILTEFALNIAELTSDKVKSNIESLQEKLDRTQNAENKTLILQDLRRNRLILDYKEGKKRTA
ncbi:MAG: atpC [Rickettsiaceae bacterium]|jgi:F-type H+-transporting ATPase subunit epsilon|nr:atpC [Rickettsiaceae bacterium]